MSLIEFLNNKPSNYKNIDIARMPKIYELYKEYFNLKPVIHIVGTNGKGSTGRWLALMLKNAGFKVGHYTSPHIVEYKERFWVDGECVSYDGLDFFHKKLLDILDKKDAKELSYFEHSTFLSALVFESCDFIIMEAGLGGEFDATNVFKKQLSIVTSIGFDHEEVLGDNIQDIAKTKLNSINTSTVLSSQQNDSVVKLAKEMALKKGVDLIYAKEDESAKVEILKYLKTHKYAEFFYANLQTAYVAAKTLKVEVDFSSLPALDLQGRCQKIRDNIYIDVGHNPLAARVIKENFKNDKIVLVYNSFLDKDYALVLNIFKPIVEHVEIIRFNSQFRKTAEDEIKKTLEGMKVPWRYFENNIDEKKIHLVFGSFHVVEEFLKRLNEK